MRQCGAIASNNSVQAALRNQTNTSREVSCSYTHYIRRNIGYWGSYRSNTLRNYYNGVTQL